MIRPERLTIKAQEAFRDAGALARERGNPVVNDAHLFAALLAQDEGVVQPLLQKAGVNVTALRESVTDAEQLIIVALRAAINSYLERAGKAIDVHVDLSLGLADDCSQSTTLAGHTPKRSLHGWRL